MGQLHFGCEENRFGSFDSVLEHINFLGEKNNWRVKILVVVGEEIVVCVFSVKDLLENSLLLDVIIVSGVGFERDVAEVIGRESVHLVAVAVFKSK